MIPARQAAEQTIQKQQEKKAAEYQYWQENWQPLFNTLITTRTEEGHVNGFLPFEPCSQLSIATAVELLGKEGYAVEGLGLGRRGLNISWQECYLQRKIQLAREEKSSEEAKKIKLGSCVGSGSDSESCDDVASR